MFVRNITELVNSNILRMKKYTCRDTNAIYFIVNYRDEYKNHAEYSIYKSIILSADENGEPDKILAFAPPHGVDYEEFKDSLEFEMPEEIVANAAIEGTMIQLFYDARIEKWNIATRGSIGGTNWFYGNATATKKQSTFRSMFIDCINGNDYINGSMDCNNAIDMETAFADWPKTNSYCFVMQHPDNQIVFDIQQPALYLVAAYKLGFSEETHSVIGVGLAELNSLVDVLSVSVSMNVRMPKLVFSRRFSEVECVYRNLENRMGVMFWNTATGQRAHMENEIYTRLREIRGNHPNLMFHFLELQKTKKTIAFLEAFPRYTQQFSGYFESIIQFSYMVYGSYVNYYIKHDRAQIPKEYFVHAAKIHHEIYVPSKKVGNVINITLLVVRNYIENLEPIKLVHYLKVFQSIDSDDEPEERALCN